MTSGLLPFRVGISIQYTGVLIPQQWVIWLITKFLNIEWFMIGSDLILEKPDKRQIHPPRLWLQNEAIGTFFRFKLVVWTYARHFV